MACPVCSRRFRRQRRALCTVSFNGGLPRLLPAFPAACPVCTVVRLHGKCAALPSAAFPIPASRVWACVSRWCYRVYAPPRMCSCRDSVQAGLADQACQAGQTGGLAKIEVKVRSHFGSRCRAQARSSRSRSSHTHPRSSGPVLSQTQPLQPHPELTPGALAAAAGAPWKSSRPAPMRCSAGPAWIVARRQGGIATTAEPKTASRTKSGPVGR